MTGEVEMARIGNEQVDGLLRGAVGSLAGLAAMGLFFRATAALSNGSDDGSDGASAFDLERHDALDDVAIGGVRSREGEPATETMARLAYHKATDHDPDAEVRRKLGQAIHWGYGVLLGGVYGAVRSGTDGLDLLGGLGYGTAAWALGDEIMVPLLGLSEGPTAHPWSDHAKALGAHLVYGAATSTATHALKRVM